MELPVDTAQQLTAAQHFGLTSKCRLQISHQQRGRHAFPGYIGQHETERVRPQIQKIVVIAAHIARSHAAGGILNRPKLLHRLREELLLHMPRNLDLRPRLTLRASPRRRLTCLFLDSAEQPQVIPRLLHKIGCAAMHRIHGQLDVSPRGHHHHRRAIGPDAELVQQVEPFLPRRRIARIVQVHQNQIERTRIQRPQQSLRRVHGFRQISGALQQQPKSLQDVRLVIADQDSENAVAGARIRCGGDSGHTSTQR